MSPHDPPASPEGSGSETEAPSGVTGERSLGEVRAELRRLGYLDHKVERFLLQDALRPRRPGRALAFLTAKVALLLGAPTALVSTLVLAWANGHLRRSAFDLLPLYLHLLAPAVALLAMGFLVLAGVFALVLRLSHARRIEALSYGLAMVVSAAGVAAAIWQGRALWPDLSTGQLGILGVALPLLAWAVFKVVHGGLLTLAIRLTDQAPEGPGARGRWWALGVVLGVCLLLLPAALEVRPPAPPAPSSLPVSGGGALLVIGVDGVKPTEVDYLLAADAMPHVGGLAAAGGAVVPYFRGDEEPGSFWASVATGLPGNRHGLETLDSYRPLGLERPLLRSGWLRSYWAVMARTPLVDHRPVLSNQRRAWAFWELASRGGAASLAVNWWGTFPAAPQPGWVVAHGAYQLLEEGTAGAVFPEAAEGALRDLGTSMEVPPDLVRGLGVALPDVTARDMLDKALRPDALYRAAFRLGLRDLGAPRAAALYLPGLDIAAGLADPGTVAMGDLVRRQLGAVDRLVAETGDTFDTVLLIFDPGRRGDDEGRAVLWHRDGCVPQASASAADLSAQGLGAAALRALGLPQSREIPEPPGACPWPDAAVRVETYGERRGETAVVEGDEYLRSLESLGYL
ncbi:MAG: hypothetical protein AAGN66_10280 [Acidobacteriota bacterium]